METICRVGSSFKLAQANILILIRLVCDEDLGDRNVLIGAEPGADAYTFQHNHINDYNRFADSMQYVSFLIPRRFSNESRYAYSSRVRESFRATCVLAANEYYIMEDEAQTK